MRMRSFKRAKPSITLDTDPSDPGLGTTPEYWFVGTFGPCGTPLHDHCRTHDSTWKPGNSRCLYATNMVQLLGSYGEQVRDSALHEMVDRISTAPGMPERMTRGLVSAWIREQVPGKKPAGD